MTWKKYAPWFGVSIAGYIINKVFETSKDILFQFIPFLQPVDFVFIGIGIIGILIYAIDRMKKPKQKLMPDSNQTEVIENKIKDYQQQIEELKKKPKITFRDSKILDDWLNKVQTEVFVLAIDGGSFSERKHQTIKELIKERDISFTFLLLDKDSELIEKLDDTLLDPNPKTGIERQLENFIEIWSEIQDKKTKLELRTYDLPPVHSMFIIDPRTDHGKMTVEFYEYKSEPDSRVNLIITKKENPKLFEKYYKSYNYVLKNSKPYNFD